MPNNRFDPNIPNFANQGSSDIEKIRQNLNALRDFEASDEYPAAPTAGMAFLHLGEKKLYLRNLANSGWIFLFDFNTGKSFHATNADNASTADNASSADNALNSEKFENKTLSQVVSMAQCAGCSWTCQGCSGTCIGTCAGTCTGTCEGTCTGTCSGACSGTCSAPD